MRALRRVCLFRGHPPSLTPHTSSLANLTSFFNRYYRSQYGLQSQQFLQAHIEHVRPTPRIRCSSRADEGGPPHTAARDAQPARKPHHRPLRALDLVPTHPHRPLDLALGAPLGPGSPHLGAPGQHEPAPVPPRTGRRRRRLGDDGPRRDARRAAPRRVAPADSPRRGALVLGRGGRVAWQWGGREGVQEGGEEGQGHVPHVRSPLSGLARRIAVQAGARPAAG